MSIESAYEYHYRNKRILGYCMNYSYIELWFNGKEIKRIIPDSDSDWYFISKPFDSTLWIGGINLYWLLQNSYKKIGKVLEPKKNKPMIEGLK